MGPTGDKRNFEQQGKLTKPVKVKTGILRIERYRRYED